MPIVFAQPDAMGSASSIGVGAGIASQDAKQMPSLVSMYEAAMRNRIALMGQSGGGRGGSSSSGGGIPVNPGGGDGGALAQVESQANREQSAMNQGFGAEISDQEQQQRYQNNLGLQNNAAQLDQQRIDKAQQAFRQQYGQQQGPTPTWDANDQKAMDDTKNGIANISAMYEAGEAGGDTPEFAQKGQQLQAKLASLQQKQQAAQQVATQQGNQQDLAAQTHQATVGIIKGQMYAQKAQSMTGVIRDPDTGRVSAYAMFDPLTGKTQLHAAKEQKPEDDGSRMSAKDFHAYVNEATKALTRKGSLGEADIKPTFDEVAEHVTKSQALYRQLNGKKAQETEKAEDNADPVTKIQIAQFSKTLPKSDGKVNFEATSPEQLKNMIGLYSRPNSGASPDIAKAVVQKAQQELARRQAPPPPVVQTPPRVTHALEPLRQMFPPEATRDADNPNLHHLEGHQIDWPETYKQTKSFLGRTSDLLNSFGVLGK